MQSLQSRSHKMVKTAMIAAIYVVLSMFVLPMASNTIQFRLGEMLTVLPAYTPLAMFGLTLGCFLFNIIGAFSGTNDIGYIDAVIGSLATLMAAMLSFWIAGNCRKRRLRYLLVPLPSVVVNAIVIGAELSLLYGGTSAFFELFVFHMIWIAIGQAVVCYLLGVPLMILLERNAFYKKLFH